MEFVFDKLTSQNIRKSLRKEWLETNGLGDYASSSLINCNARKYHGLLVTGMGAMERRSVLLSTLDESVSVGGRELYFSCHKYPGRYYPYGHEYLYGVKTGKWTAFTYHFGGFSLIKELMLMPGKRLLLIKYTLVSSDAKLPEITLNVHPLTAFRHFHDLARENADFNTALKKTKTAFSMKPYDSQPSLHMAASGKASFTEDARWYYNLEYLLEEERGFAHQEDLFQPGVFEIKLINAEPVYLMASTEDLKGVKPEELWGAESLRREEAEKNAKSIDAHLAKVGEQFLVSTPDGGLGVVAGYHWFNIWGRDMYIALPGLTFCAGREEAGIEVLRWGAKSLKGGLIPNCFSSDGEHSYNSVDASLWYIWAVQQLLIANPKRMSLVKKEFWPVIKEIIEAYAGGRVPFVRMDAEAYLHVGDENTQLTWMDAMVDGKPVTPRYGCPVEITSLWYNALAFCDELAVEFGESKWQQTARLASIRDNFLDRYWVEDANRGDYIADVWRPGFIDKSVRPNQIFSVSMPYPVLKASRHKNVVICVRHFLLTPFGVRTLAPGTEGYKPFYEGSPEARDSAYHQGTVWAWLIAAYGESRLKSTGDKDRAAKEVLNSLTPLFTEHLYDAGTGTISEIFDADPPHLPDGTISQAWSVAEALRLLNIIKNTAPDVYASWSAEKFGGI